jgi:hypothetical protein
MGNKLIENSLKAHELYLNGLNSEDTALSARFYTFLTFNSLFALAFVGALQKGFDPFWKPVLLIGIPSVSIVLNIFWLYLGARTILSFVFFFCLSENIEKELKEIDSKSEQSYLRYFYFASARRKFWNENKKGILKYVSVPGGANKMFCFLLPLCTYTLWSVVLFTILLSKISCLFVIIIIAAILVGLGVLAFIIQREVNKKTKDDYTFKFPNL